MMVTDRGRYAGGDVQERLNRVVEDAGRAARAGVDLIQVRERGLDDRALFDLVRRIAERAESRALVLVNRRTDIALAARVHGVHLPSDAPVASRVRSLLPADAILGRSVHSVNDAIAAQRDGACDYLMFGTVYRSASKPPDHVPAGIDALRTVCEAVDLPVLAVGGIEPERAADVAAAGAAGIAAIGMFAAPAGDDPEQVVHGRVANVRAAFDPRRTARLQ